MPTAGRPTRTANTTSTALATRASTTRRLASMPLAVISLVSMALAIQRASTSVASTVTMPCKTSHSVSCCLPMLNEMPSSASTRSGNRPVMCKATTAQARKAKPRSKLASHSPRKLWRSTKKTIRITASDASSGTATDSRLTWCHLCATMRTATTRTSATSGNATRLRPRRPRSRVARSVRGALCANRPANPATSRQSSNSAICHKTSACCKSDHRSASRPPNSLPAITVAPPGRTAGHQRDGAASCRDRPWPLCCRHG